jgi:Chlorophyll A-B binding protein
MTQTPKTTTTVANTSNSTGFGFTAGSELLNGRLAMIGFLAAVSIELFTGKGFLHFWGIL